MSIKYNKIKHKINNYNLKKIINNKLKMYKKMNRVLTKEVIL